MAQAKGALGYLAFVPEVTWNSTPGSPAMIQLKAGVYGESMGMEIDEHISNSINAIRAVETVRGGNKHFKGSVPIEFAALGLATVLKHALGPVSTSGAGPYVHTIKRGALAAGMTLEKGFTDIAQYFVFTGAKPEKLAGSVSPSGMFTGSLDFIAGGMTASGTPLDATLTTSVHTPFMEHEAVVTEGGGAVTVLAFDFEITNKLDEVLAVGQRGPAAVTEGMGECTGNVTMMFENLTAFNKFLNETASELKIIFTNGANILEFYFPEVRYIGDAVPKIATSQGVVVPLKFRAIYDTSELTDVKITFTNTETTI